jgi:hypothetical protein
MIWASGAALGGGGEFNFPAIYHEFTSRRYITSELEYQNFGQIGIVNPDGTWQVIDNYEWEAHCGSKIGVYANWVKNEVEYRFRIFGYTFGTICHYSEVDCGYASQITVGELFDIEPVSYEEIVLGTGQFRDYKSPSEGTTWVEVPFGVSHYTANPVCYFPGYHPSDFPWY